MKKEKAGKKAKKVVDKMNPVTDNIMLARQCVKREIQQINAQLVGYDALVTKREKLHQLMNILDKMEK